MADLKPILTHKIEFPYKDVLTPNDVLAQWIANLGRGLNDLLLANRRLEQGFNTEGPGHEVIYDMKAAATHAWELAKFLRENESDEVKQFISELDSKMRNNYRTALDALQDPEPESSPQQRSFKSYLASARDQASHYSRLDHKLLVRALTRLGEDEDGEVSYGAILIGDTYKDFFCEFASQLDYQLFFAVKGKNLEPLKEFVAQLREVVLPLMSFAVDAHRVYLTKYQSEIKVTELSS